MDAACCGGGGTEARRIWRFFSCDLPMPVFVLKKCDVSDWLRHLVIFLCFGGDDEVFACSFEWNGVFWELEETAQKLTEC